MNNYFTNKIVWVTGASSGIGEALCIALDRQGATVLLSARNETGLQRVRASMKGASHLVVPLDLSETDGFGQLVADVIGKTGRVDLLINNGGISQRSLAEETTLATDRKLMDVNFFGAVALTKALLPHFIARKSGHIVTLTSVTGIFGTPFRSGYAASKHALHGYFDSLRAEIHRYGIAVTLVCPGFIRTSITVNALTGDGSALGTMDTGTSNGMDVNLFAEKMLRAVSNRKIEAHIGGPKEKFGIFMKRFFPGIFHRMIRKISVR